MQEKYTTPKGILDAIAIFLFNNDQHKLSVYVDECSNEVQDTYGDDNYIALLATTFVGVDSEGKDISKTARDWCEHFASKFADGNMHYEDSQYLNFTIECMQNGACIEAEIIDFERNVDESSFTKEDIVAEVLERYESLGGRKI